MPAQVHKPFHDTARTPAELTSITKMLFFSFFKTLVDREVRVELKNNITIRGTLKSVDQYLNIKLDDVTTVNEIKYPHLVRRRELEGLLRWDGWSLEVRMGLADGVDEMWDKQEEDA
ncbi:hypothetical protein LTR28_008068 [Elasticomyces elasticus]|nr:hypothetical protein LTR28_008068 [Elasticomyces elasticus]